MFKVGDWVELKPDQLPSPVFNEIKPPYKVRGIKGDCLLIFPENLSKKDGWFYWRFNKAGFKTVCKKIANNE